MAMAAETADRFLIGALAQSECLPSTTSSDELNLAALTSENFVAIVCRCLTRIQLAESVADLALPESQQLPNGVAARHRLGSQLANALKDLGYAGDCGYNHFLYPIEKETRAILAWLVSKIPQHHLNDAANAVCGIGKDGDAAISGARDRDLVDALEEEALCSVFSAWMRKKTLPVMPNRHLPVLRGHQRVSLRTDSVLLPWETVERAEDSWCLFDGLLKQASKAQSLLETLSASQTSSGFVSYTYYADDDADRLTADGFGGRIEQPVESPSLQSSELLKDDEETHQEQEECASLPHLPVFVSAANALAENEYQANAATHATPEPVRPTGDTLLESLREEGGQAELDHVQVRMVETQRSIEITRLELEREIIAVADIERRIEEMKVEGREMKAKLESRKRILGLLPHAQANIAKLEGICAKNESKLKTLSMDWSQRKRLLAEEEEQLLSMNSTRKARCRKLISEMKIFRTEMKDIATVIQERMETVHTLEKMYTNLPQGVSRNSYTNRIMDITKQVHKQKQEITKIIEDIKTIQKQLNVSSEKLKRTEAVTDEKLFTAASKHTDGASSKGVDSPYVECYRKFAQVRELFEELILVLGDVGKKESAARDLENWITQLQGRDSRIQLEKVLADIQSIKQENAALNEQLRNLSSY